MGAELAIEDWSGGGGTGAASLAAAEPPLVLIHGLATTRWIWELVAPTLAERRRVVTLDLPGFGDSEPAGAGYEPAEVAERIADGLAGHGISGAFDLVGHSLGGCVATALAVAHPAAIRRMVLVAPAGFGALPAGVSRAVIAGADPFLAVRRRMLGVADFAWGRRLLLAGAAADGAAIAPGIARRMVTASISAQRTAEALEMLGEGRLGALLAETRMPLGVIWGREDRTVPARHTLSVRRIRPDAEFELLDGTGHVPMVERPEAFVAALERLLAVAT